MPKIEVRGDTNAVILHELPKQRRRMIADEPVLDERYPAARIMARAIGDSMNDAGIVDGDLFFVVPEENAGAAEGKIVLCRVGGTLYLKRLVTDGVRLSLISESPRYAPIEIRKPDDAFTLLGIVIGRSGQVE